MQRCFYHAIVSMLLTSLMVSGCYSSRSLAVLVDRDAVTVEQARYEQLRATPHEQLSEAELAERDMLHRAQFERDSVNAATEEEFDRHLLIQRDSIILEQARYELIVSTPNLELGQVEETSLRHQQMQRERTLAVVDAELQDRGLDIPATIIMAVLGVVVLAGIVVSVAFAVSCGGGSILDC